MIWTILFALVLVTITLCFPRYLQFRANKKRFPYPGNPGFFLGNVIQRFSAVVQHKAVDWFEKTYAECGPVFQIFNFLGNDEVMIVDANWSEYVLMEKNWKKGPNYKFGSKYNFAGGLFAEPDKESWKAQRRTLAQAFSPTSIKGQVRFIHEELEVLLEKLERDSQTGNRVKIDDYFKHFTFDFIGKSAFGVEFDALKNEKEHPIERSLLHIMERLILLMIFPPLRFPWLPETRKMIKNVDIIRKLAADMIKQEREKMKDTAIDESKMSLCQLCLCIKDPETGLPISDKLIVDNVTAFMFAGTDTTANAMSFSMWELCLNPHVFAKAREEVDRVFEGQRRMCEYRDVPKLEYLNMVIKEVLRKHAASGLERTIEEDTTINGITVKKGVTVTFLKFLYHFNPKYYHDPEKFIPERWTKEEVAKRPKGCYIPFSLGARDCIGKVLANTELVIVLATLISRFDFRLDESVSVRKRMLLTLSPVPGIFVYVNPRRERQNA